MRKLVWVTGLCNRDNPLCRQLLFLKSALQSLLALWELASQCHSRFIFPESLLVGRQQGQFSFRPEIKVPLSLVSRSFVLKMRRGKRKSIRTYVRLFSFFSSFSSTPSFSDWCVKAGLSHLLPQCRQRLCDTSTLLCGWCGMWILGMCHRGVLPQQPNWSDSISSAADLDFQKFLMSFPL